MTPNSQSENHPDPIPFIILTMARSGSTHLVSLLRQHPDVTCYGEPLNTQDGGFPYTDSELIAAVFSGGAAAATGAKILAEQLHDRPHTIGALCRVPNIRFIVLQRRNQLDRVRSITQAQSSGIWAWGAGYEPPSPPVVRLDRQDCLTRFAEAQRFYSDCTALLPRRRTAWIFYEELREHQDETMEPVWKMLGVDSPGHLPPTMTKLEQRPPRESIENYDELCAYGII